VAKTVIGVAFKKVDTLPQGVVEQEVIVHSKHHVRGGDLLNAVGQLFLRAQFAKLWQVLIGNSGEILTDAGVRDCRGVQYLDRTGERTVVLQRTTQKSGPFMADHNQRQQSVE